MRLGKRIATCITPIIAAGLLAACATPAPATPTPTKAQPTAAPTAPAATATSASAPATATTAPTSAPAKPAATVAPTTVPAATAAPATATTAPILAPTKPAATVAPATTPTTAAAGDIAAGQTVFQASCNACHPGGGQGVGPSIKGTSPDTVKKTVRSGKGNMPAFSASSISDTQLDNLAAYVASLK